MQKVPSIGQRRHTPRRSHRAILTLAVLASTALLGAGASSAQSIGFRGQMPDLAILNTLPSQNHTLTIPPGLKISDLAPLVPGIQIPSNLHFLSVSSLVPSGQISMDALRSLIGSVSATGALPADLGAVTQIIGDMSGKPVQAAPAEISAGHISITRIDRISNAARLFTTDKIIQGFLTGAPVIATIDFRGVRGSVSVDARNSTVMVHFPSAGVLQSVQANSISEAEAKVAELLYRQSRDITRRFLQAAVAETTADPVAGGPFSMIGRMSGYDQRAAARSFGWAPEAVWHAEGGRFYGFHQTWSGNGNPTDLQSGSYGGGVGYSYDFSPGGFGMFLEALGGQEYAIDERPHMGTVSAGIRLPLIRGESIRWAIVPAVRFGAIGAEDIGFGSMAMGGALTSDLQVRLPNGLNLAAATTVSHYSTLPFHGEHFVHDYNIRNTLIRNSFGLSQRVGEIWERPIALGAFVSSTRVTGSRWASDNWREYGLQVTVGERTPARGTVSAIEGSRGVSGFMLGIGMAF